MSDEIKIEAHCWDGKGEANFDMKRNRRSTLSVWIDQEHLTIEGLEYEGENSIYIPIDLIKRAIAAAESVCKTEET